MPDTDIAWLLPDGSGGAPLDDGTTVRVPGVIPGDRVRWTEVDRRGRGVRGELVEILAPSPERRGPPCPWDARCGGCDLSHVRPTARRSYLAAVVARSLGLVEPPEVVHSDDSRGQRARIKLTIESGQLGYRAPRSHEIVPIEGCGIAHPLIDSAIRPLRAWLEAHATDALASVELRTDGERVVHNFETRSRPNTETRAALAELTPVALDGRVHSGDATLRVPVAGLRLFAGPSVFFQVNLELNEALAGFVHRAIKAISPERVLDLYAGIGNLGLPLAAAGVPVIAVEQQGRALADLQRTVEAYGIKKMQTLALDARRFDPSREPFDAAILDPPRAGAGDVLGRVLRSRPRRVVIVSCDVRSAGRDVRAAQAQGYRVAEVRCFDLFNQTRHVETVTVLDR